MDIEKLLAASEVLGQVGNALCRFGTNSLSLISFSVHQKVTINLMYAEPRQGSRVGISAIAPLWEGNGQPFPDLVAPARFQHDGRSGDVAIPSSPPGNTPRDVQKDCVSVHSNPVEQRQRRVVGRARSE